MLNTEFQPVIDRTGCLIFFPTIYILTYKENGLLNRISGSSA